MARYDKFAERHLQIISKSGIEFYALCPFHEDHKPSFALNGNTGLYFCHGCGAKGTIDTLALHFGSVLEPMTTGDIKDRLEGLSNPNQKSERVRVLPEEWLMQFDHPTDYWNVRGISELIQEEFGLGYDPTWDAVTIPIRNDDSDLLGVVRRRLAKVGPKYVYPKGFKKASYLYASWMLESRSVAVVEGPIDALACWNAGVPALALYGSHLSERQIELMGELSITTVTIMTDRDMAGNKAALQLAQIPGVMWKIPEEWPDGCKDPGDMTQHQIRMAFSRSANSWSL